MTVESAASRVVFLVAHLTGSGHLARTLAIARAVKAAGGAPTVLSGGAPAPHLDARGVDLVQLPPVSVSDLDYAALRDDRGRPVDDAHMARRRAAILDALERLRPDRLVVETFPFGRRMLAEEFEAALERAVAMGARAFCSVRDIPEPPRRPDRFAEAARRLARFDMSVLSHGDPALLPFSAGWRETDSITGRLRATGYVSDPAPPPCGDPDEALVAVGGGALGRAMLETAVEAARRGDRPWRLRVGGRDAAEEAARLTALARGAPVIAEPAAPDYRARLGAAAASLSLCGCNTASDLLAAGTPAVLCPMTEGREREQAIRAVALARRAQFDLLPDPTDAEAMARMVEEAARRGRETRDPPVDLDGAATSARALLEPS